MSLEELLAWIPAGHPDEMLVRQVDFDRLPEHIAIIMDGNGRWAALRHLPRVEGHRAGIDAVRDTVETAARLGRKITRDFRNGHMHGGKKLAGLNKPGRFWLTAVTRLGTARIVDTGFVGQEGDVLTFTAATDALDALTERLESGKDHS